MLRPFNSARDRTQEFTGLVERLSRDQGGPSSVGEASTSHSTVGVSKPSSSSDSHQTAFARKATDIGQGIHSTSQKLLKLSQLAKAPPGPFDDNAQAISALSAAVKKEIQQLNATIADLQSISVSGAENGKQSGRHSSTVVGSLRARLKNTTQEFKDVLTIRQENLKTHQDRRQIFSALPERPARGGRVGAAGDAGFSRGGNDGALFPANAYKPASSSGQQQPAAEKYATSAPPLSSSRTADLLPSSPPVLRKRAATTVRRVFTPGLSDEGRQPLLEHQAQSQALMVPQQDTYMNSRAEALQHVESTINELGGIFQQLATMVQEQGEMAIRIDENVDDTLANVESAQAQLLKYLNSISSNRWLVMKVFFVLMLFLIVFVVFIA